MSETSAQPEYCTYCHRRLGAVRTIISGASGAWGDYLKFHPACVEPWREMMKRPQSDTSNRASQP